jgi:hypothetical protein
MLGSRLDISASNMCTAANGGRVLFSTLGEALETDYNPVANVVKKAAFRQ